MIRIFVLATTGPSEGGQCLRHGYPASQASALHSGVRGVPDPNFDMDKDIYCP
jgi:hypothetical protein